MNNIIDPSTNETYELHSTEGLKLLKSYVRLLMKGGSGTYPGGKSQGRGGKGKKNNPRTRSRYSTARKNLESIKSRKIDTQTKKGEIKNIKSNARQQAKLAERKLNELSSSKLPHTRQLIENFDRIIGMFRNEPTENSVSPLKIAEELNKQLKPKDQVLFDNFQSNMYSADVMSAMNVSYLNTQGTFAFSYLRKKEQPWWAKMMFAVLFLSIVKNNFNKLPRMTSLEGDMPAEFRHFNTFGKNTFEFYDSVWNERLQQDIAMLLKKPELETNEKGQEVIAKNKLKTAKDGIETAKTVAKEAGPAIKRTIMATTYKLLEKWNEKAQPTIDRFTPDIVRQAVGYAARRTAGVVTDVATNIASSRAAGVVTDAATNIASTVANETERARERIVTHVQEAEYIPYVLMILLMLSMFGLGYNHIEL